MLNESLVTLTLNELKDTIFGMSMYHIALTYILMYVVYKALGRYIYFKPQEHSSKINRTFLAISLLVVILHSISWLVAFLPFLPEYRWLYAVCSLLILVAPLSIFMDKMIWGYRHGRRYSKDWHYSYLPIPNDYYRTNIEKSESTGNNVVHSWEEEGVESTSENIHSDALLNTLALVTFIFTSWYWAYESTPYYGCVSVVFFALSSLPIGGIFFDRAVFSWIDYLTNKWTKTQ